MSAIAAKPMAIPMTARFHAAYTIQGVRGEMHHKHSEDARGDHQLPRPPLSGTLAIGFATPRTYVCCQTPAAATMVCRVQSIVSNLNRCQPDEVRSAMECRNAVL